MLYEVITPASAYSYVYQGQAQTLDQIFINGALYDNLVTVEAAHINSDWTIGEYDGEARGNSDHDPQIGRFSNQATLDKLAELVLYYQTNGFIVITSYSIHYTKLYELYRMLWSRALRIQNHCRP